MKYLMLFIFSLLGVNLHAQNVAFVVAAHSSENTVRSTLEYRLSRDISELDSATLAMHYHSLASCYQYYNKPDSTKYYLDLSFSYSPNWICYFTRQNVIRDVPESSYLIKANVPPYFVSYLDDAYIKSFFDRCKACNAYEKPKPKKRNKL